MWQDCVKRTQAIADDRQTAYVAIESSQYGDPHIFQSVPATAVLGLYQGYIVRSRVCYPTRPTIEWRD